MADETYKRILNRADEFFNSVFAAQTQNLQCGRGCSLCCYGLFEIGSADVPVVADGLEKLHPMRRKKIIRRAVAIMAESATRIFASPRPSRRSNSSTGRPRFPVRTSPNAASA